MRGLGCAATGLALVLAAGCGARTAPAGLEEGETRGDGGQGDGGPPPPPERCDGLDDDRDGEVDEGCDCGFGEVRECAGDPPPAGVERCASGTQRCANGAWGECEGVVHCTAREETFTYDDAVDLVLLVDQSESMRPHFESVLGSVHALADAVAASERPYRLILLGSRTGEHGLCLPPPLGGPECTESERLRQIDVEVGSRDALDLLLEHRGEVQAAARPHSQRSILVVTDDDAWRIGLHDDIGGLPGWGGYYLDAVIGTWESRCDIARRGVAYEFIAGLTGGDVHDICTADLAPTFERIAADVLRRPRRFPLAERPFHRPRVFVGEDGLELGDGEWRYDRSRNAVVVPRSAGLDPGVPLTVRYRVAL